VAPPDVEDVVGGSARRSGRPARLDEAVVGASVVAMGLIALPVMLPAPTVSKARLYPKISVRSSRSKLSSPPRAAWGTEMTVRAVLSNT
jgi:hypothetical protein